MTQQAEASETSEVASLTSQTMGKKHLPQPRGPHSVGFVDALTSGDTGVLVRIYYPTKVRKKGLFQTFAASFFSQIAQKLKSTFLRPQEKEEDLFSKRH